MDLSAREDIARQLARANRAEARVRELEADLAAMTKARDNWHRKYGEARQQLRGAVDDGRRWTITVCQECGAKAEVGFPCPRGHGGIKDRIEVVRAATPRGAVSPPWPEGRRVWIKWTGTRCRATTARPGPLAEGWTEVVPATQAEAVSDLEEDPCS